jgi:DNA-binding FadR family transcriptional regulator
MATALQNLIDRLRHEVESGTLAPGGRLPAERDLARDLVVSRGTLRKALLALEQEGRIWRHVGQGTFIGPGGRKGANSLGGMMRETSPSEVMEVRAMLEPQIAALAALRATPSDLQEMDLCVANGERAAEARAFENWDSRLHRLVAASARNAMLLGLFDTVNAARRGELWGRLKAASLTPERRRIYAREHARLVAAIRDRDSEQARQSMSAHLASVRHHLLR